MPRRVLGPGAYIHYALHNVSPKKTRDQYIEAMSKVCDGLRGDAFVTAQEVGFDNLCETVDASTRY